MLHYQYAYKFLSYLDVHGPKPPAPLLNCGLRISELIGLNMTDIQDDALRVLGKGNKVKKERRVAIFLARVVALSP